MKNDEHKTRDGGTLIDLLMFRYLPFWPLYLVLAVTFLILAKLYLLVSIPVYESQATLLIRDEKKGVENARMVESFNTLDSKNIVENEIEVIKSRTLLRQTIEKLQLCSPIYEDRFIIDLTAYHTSPISVEIKDFTKIQASEKVAFETTKDSVNTSIGKFPINQWVTTKVGELRFIPNSNLKVAGDGPFYFRILDPRKLLNATTEQLRVVSSNKLSTVVNLYYRDEVPERGESILNILIESYNATTAKNKNQLAISTLNFVDERIGMVERELDSLEINIQLYKSNNGIVDLNEQSRVFLRNVGDNDQLLSELDMQMAVLTKVEDYVVNKGDNSKIIPATIGIKDERLSTLIQKLYDAEIQYASLRKTTAENNPILLSLLSEIENMRPSILEIIRNQKQSVATSRQNLEMTNSKYNSALNTIPRKERELLEASRLQAIKNNVYTFLLQKREETALSAGSKDGDNRVVDAAESSIKPVSPNKLAIYLGALFASTVGGTVYILRKELFSHAIQFRAEIEEQTDIPIALEIPQSIRRSQLIIEEDDEGIYYDHLIQLRVALGLVGKASHKVILVTSLVEGEGKSFISNNFALSLADTAKRILLVDFDFRNPSTSKLFQAGNVPGVAEFLSREASLSSIVRKTAKHNLFLISAGRNRKTGIEKLLEGECKSLFDEVKASFDVIIIDAPPMLPVADARVIAPYCDTTLFVVRHGVTPKNALHRLGKDKSTGKLKNPFIIFNGVKIRGYFNKNYGYGYAVNSKYPYKRT